MSSEFELDDISNKSRASSRPLNTPVDLGPVPLATSPEDFREGTIASWTWAAAGMFVVRLSAVDEQSDNLDPACYHGRVPSYSYPISCSSPLASLNK